MGTMISFRRLILSFLAGGLILMAGVASASADPATALERATNGVARGLEAVSEIVDTEAGTVVADAGLARATLAFQSWAERHGGTKPGKAAEVHAQLMSEDIPGRLNAQSKLTSISGAFETLKAQADTMKAEKAKGPKDGKPDTPDQAKNP